MTSEEMQEMNIKEVADRFLSNKCGSCNICFFQHATVLIGKSSVTLCHLIYSILREDRKQELRIQSSTMYGINEKGEIKCLR